MIVGLAGLASADDVDAPGGAACVAATDEAECEGVAASVTGNASGDQSAVTATGDAECQREDCAAVTATGNATGSRPASATGGCREESHHPYTRCQDARVSGDAEGYNAAASGFGDAKAYEGAAASGIGDAQAYRGVAASGTGEADGMMAGVSGTDRAEAWDGAAVSGTGDAEGRRGAAAATGNATCSGRQCVAATVNGNATGSIPASGDGECDDGGGQGGESCYEAAVHDDAEGHYAAASGTGDANASDGYQDRAVAASGTGDAHGATAAVSGLGDAEAGGAPKGVAVAASGDGEADAEPGNLRVPRNPAGVPRYGLDSAAVAASGTDDADATGGIVAVAASGTGDASARDGVILVGETAVSGTGNATGSIPVSATGHCRDDRDDRYRPCQDVAVHEDTHGYHLAASVDGDARAESVGGAAVSVTGDTHSFYGPSATVTGNSTGLAPTSVTGGCRTLPSDPYRPCLDVRVEDDARAHHAAASGEGSADADGTVAAAASGTDAAHSDGTVVGVAVSGTGEATCSASVCVTATASAPAEMVDERTPSRGEAGHYGVYYANATYEAAKFALSSEDERGYRNGPPHTYDDDTERGADMIQEVAGIEEEVPDLNRYPISSFLQYGVLRPLYEVLDDTLCTPDPADEVCATDVTGDAVDAVAPVTDPAVETAVDCGHAAVDAVDASPGAERGCPTPDTPLPWDHALP